MASAFRFQVCRRIGLVLVAVLVGFSGCATTQFVRLRESPRSPLTERLKATSFGNIRTSSRTEYFLQSTDYRGPADLKELLRHATEQHERFQRSEPYRSHESLHAIAELNYLGAQSAAGRDPALASELYVDSAQAAWLYYSTPNDSGRLPNPAEALHRSTAEVYNASCEQLLRSARRHGGYVFGQSIHMPLTGRTLLFEVPFETRQISKSRLGPFEFVSDYKIQNLRNAHGAEGLGVPLIAGRKPAESPDPVEDFYTRGMAVAATAVLRFPDGELSSAATSHEPIRLQVFDPRESDGIVVGETLLPLETEFSTPLARYLSNPDLKLLDTWGFFRPDRARTVQGLYMVQPFDPDRIPVLMVHGLWSSPMTWMEMFNDLQADPQIGRKYQFWFYLYPTGEPLAFAAANLRDELNRVRTACDPNGTNPKLDQMVMVGHSMGGLISHMLTIDSDDRLWNSVSQRPVDQLPAKPEERHEIRRVFFFESNPSIDRIVTIASPYGGSRYTNSFVRWLSGSVIWLPSRTLQLSRLVFEQSQTDWWDRLTINKTSLDSLTKKSAILTLIRNTHVPPDVKHHNIVGIGKGRSADDWTDGVVSFRSAHRDDVASEITVPAKHSDVHRHPDTISEVRRILHEHLEVSHRQRFPVIPVGHEDHPPGRATVSPVLAP